MHYLRTKKDKYPLVIYETMVTVFPHLCRLLFSSCGSSQWRLQGPHAWRGAEELVRKTPMTDMMNFTGFVLVVVIGVFLLMALCCMCKVTACLF